MSRLREIGLAPGRLPTGPHNAITDVAGVRVGQETIIEGAGALVPGRGPVRTGVTAILPHGGDLFQEKTGAAVYTINGYGKAAGFEQVRELGTLETPILLTNTLNVGRAADALVSYMIRQNPAIGIQDSSVNPVVGETNDGFLNDLQGRHVTEAHVFAALEGARSGPVAEGCTGAGTGTVCCGFKGGIGTASRRVAHESLPGGALTVGALVQTNYGERQDLTIMGVPVGQALAGELLPQAGPDKDAPGPGSIMIVLATDAPLAARQLFRLAKRAPLGLARTGSYCHDGSGDFVIAFSTTRRYAHRPEQPITQVAQVTHPGAMNGLFLAVVESVEEAIYNALTAAQTMTGRDGNTLFALPLDRLAALMRQHNRLPA